MSESIVEALPAPDLVSLEKVDIADDASDSDESSMPKAEITKRKRGETFSRRRSESNTVPKRDF
jgi:hypothetical protein